MAQFIYKYNKKKKNKTKKDHGYESIIMGVDIYYNVLCSAVDSLRLSIYFLLCSIYIKQYLYKNKIYIMYVYKIIRSFIYLYILYNMYIYAQVSVVLRAAAFVR